MSSQQRVYGDPGTQVCTPYGSIRTHAHEASSPAHHATESAQRRGLWALDRGSIGVVRINCIRTAPSV